VNIKKYLGEELKGPASPLPPSAQLLYPNFPIGICGDQI